MTGLVPVGYLSWQGLFLLAIFRGRTCRYWISFVAGLVVVGYPLYWLSVVAKIDVSWLYYVVEIACMGYNPFSEELGMLAA